MAKLYRTPNCATDLMSRTIARQQAIKRYAMHGIVAHQSGMSEVAKQLGRSMTGLRRQTESNMSGQRADRCAPMKPSGESRLQLDPLTD